MAINTNTPQIARQVQTQTQLSSLVQPKPKSGVEDANNAEEIAMSFSAKASEKNAKQKSKENRANNKKRLESIEKLQQIQGTWDAEDKGKSLLSAVKMAKNLQRECDDLIQERGEEPAEIYQALKFALSQADEKHKPEIERALDHMIDEHAVSIQTSMTIAPLVDKMSPNSDLAKSTRMAVAEANQKRSSSLDITKSVIKQAEQISANNNANDISDNFTAIINGIGKSQRFLLKETHECNVDRKFLDDSIDGIYAANGALGFLRLCDDEMKNYKGGSSYEQ